MSDEPNEGGADAAPPEQVQPRRSRAPWLALVAVLLAAGLTTLFWLDSRERLGATQEETARRLRDMEAATREAKDAARQALDGAREAQAKAAQLEAKLAESQSQQLSLEALYQELS
ncbi:MAG TPA: hypothetical protein VLC53_14940, partial [Myxococcota bacterium]|nr:hypothetical protein [Myxococcota bacterium]